MNIGPYQTNPEKHCSFTMKMIVESLRIQTETPKYPPRT